VRAEVCFGIPLINLSFLLPNDGRLGVWVAYIKRQLGIATQVSVIKVKVTVAKNRKSFSALWLIHARLSLWEAYIKIQLRLAIKVSVSKVKVSVA